MGAVMCIAIPGQIIELRDPEGFTATVDVAGVCRVVNAALLSGGSDAVQAGDWVLIHAGHAVARVDEQEALETLRLLEEL
jgi:hydrogenase expression/formation protein HypC